MHDVHARRLAVFRANSTEGCKRKDKPTLPTLGGRTLRTSPATHTLEAGQVRSASLNTKTIRTEGHAHRKRNPCPPTPAARLRSLPWTRPTNTPDEVGLRLGRLEPHDPPAIPLVVPVPVHPHAAPDHLVRVFRPVGERADRRGGRDVAPRL